MKIKTAFEKLLVPIKLALYPRKCICCGKTIAEESRLCAFCARHFERVDPKKRCLHCGQEKRDCECKYRAHYFEGLIAPFYNTGLARKTLYAYKLSSRQHYAEYFAAEMARSVKEEYKGVEFGGICYVPTAYRAKVKRGFDQSRLLAEKISDILGIPVIYGVVCRRPGGTGQHNLSLKERDIAAKKRYYCAGRLTAEKILLIDDIATTCSTLDACAHQLLIAGVGQVYCVTALISDGRIRRKKKADTIEKKAR